MQIVCPNCASAYAVADNALGEHGRQVRCAACKHVWFAGPAAAEPVIAEMADALANAVPAGSASPPAPESESPPPGETAGEQTHIEDAPPIAPESPEPAAQEEPPARHDYFAVRRRKVARREAQKNYGITMPRIAVALACVIAALVFWRDGVVRFLPQTASLYARVGLPVNLRGVEFADVTTGYETQDGVRVMVVEGEIRNVTSSVRQVGKLRYALRNAAGVEIYTWTGVPDRTELAPGEAQKFRTRLASPPSDRHDLSVRFLQARDLAAAKP